jgi:hypothetical protein
MMERIFHLYEKDKKLIEENSVPRQDGREALSAVADM